MRHGDYAINEVARLTGTTSRTLRHYDDVGLLPPSRVGHNGYRFYDDAALLRLQRILLFRQLGLPVPAIREILDAEGGAPASYPEPQAGALRTHLTVLRGEQERLARQIAAVEDTLRTLEGGGELMAENMFDGFDHTEYKDEVTERWGADAYKKSDAWWRSMGEAEKADWQERTRRLGADWAAAAEAGTAPDSAAAQELAARHVAWLSGVPGTPGAVGEPDTGYLLGLADMYVADPRFAANYGGTGGAEFVRAALTEWVARRG
ncbi:MerR family transcriptional regulator [Zhihengliuella salsuginis]|uniref:MerR family transcriptional regulator n=1 Tax=Zhihengliuella salsuginis TaxID=578222 RepID=A0ABQ3GKS6_9MICC|nr:MerR family transcriptional regulator [Zhihengliuella salsuginis]GHD10939.1 MerR family transcriptional regulator [Zhihengliuella salsuginis]